MGALPKKKRTRARIGNRRPAYRVEPSGLTTCPQCRNYKRPHHVCPTCGYYNGREVVPKTQDAG